MMDILKKDVQFVYVILLYGVVVSVCSLVVPIAIQALVNTVGFVNLSQPLIVLSFIILSVLLVSIFFQGLQIYMIELFHRKIFARLGSELAIRIFYTMPKTFREKNGLNHVNQFFDVIQFHKSLAHLIIDGFTMVLQLVVGLTLISFYHPFFLGFTVFLLILIYLTLKVWGSSAMKTSIEESKAKYHFVSWLQDSVRSNLITQAINNREFVFQRSEELIQNYTRARASHFRSYFSQTLSLLVIYAITSAAIIGLGGFLVMRSQLSIGQLVAAEIIVTGILFNLAKSSRYLEIFYDLVASIYKIKELFEIPVGKIQERAFDKLDEINFRFDQVEVKLDKKKVTLDIEIPYRSRIYIYVESAPCKELFVGLIHQNQLPIRGTIFVNDDDYQRLLPQELKSIVYIVRDPVTISGTIRENLTMSDPTILDSDMYKLFDIFELSDTISSFEKGIDTEINFNGYPFWKSKLICLDIIRGILSKPKMIVLTETFRLLDPDLQSKIVEYLSGENRTWSLINFASKDTFDQKQYDKTYTLNWKGFR